MSDAAETAIAEGREPLLVASDLRVDVDGIPSCDGLTLRASGDRVLVLGAPRTLFEAAAGRRPVVRGDLLVRGTSIEKAVAEGMVAGAPLDPPLPKRWTAIDYVTWSARLAGHSANDARTFAKEAIALVQLGAMAQKPLEGLVTHAKRGVVLASALATGAEVIVVEDPLAALPEELARTFAKVFVQALAGRAWIVMAARMSLTSPIAISADEALIVSSSRVEAQGPPAEIAAATRRYVAKIMGPLDALEARLTARGGKMDVQGAQVVLDLGASMTTTELLGMCADVDATVVEMVPVARALT